MTTGMRVCALTDLDDHKPVAFVVGDVPVVLVRDGDAVHALRDECSHAELALSEGEISKGRGGRLSIECWLHGSCFDLRTGEPSSPPATEPVEVYPVSVSDSDVYVDATVPINRS
ncbi:MAG TPA: non-heme iron oxygenase ferredoxin subunit [Pseudonocardiaceae bacterium]|jgi:3-phenylpropionate/trans-cinnamate dioxygenase ferredoxin subunit|nr:non-heme iron oxygenase ferredoxin subunit [Pseudonocardiaceae bacterium]